MLIYGASNAKDEHYVPGLQRAQDGSARTGIALIHEKRHSRINIQNRKHQNESDKSKKARFGH
jgi:hypothetical protein